MAHFLDLAVTFRQKWLGLQWFSAPVGDIFLIFSQHQRKWCLLRTWVRLGTNLRVWNTCACLYIHVMMDTSLHLKMLQWCAEHLCGHARIQMKEYHFHSQWLKHFLPFLTPFSGCCAPQWQLFIAKPCIQVLKLITRKNKGSFLNSEIFNFIIPIPLLCESGGGHFVQHI